jgi:hypothetical protein
VRIPQVQIPLVRILVLGIEFVLVEFLCSKIHTSEIGYLVPTKGQLISKWFLGSSISSKKRTNEFNFTTMIPQVDLFSFVFWRKLTTPKNHFEIN